MTPLQQIKAMIEFGERVFEMIPEIRNHRFDMACEDLIDALMVEIHRTVKEHGLQREYHKMTEGTSFEDVADDWLAKNPFNPETTSV